MARGRVIGQFARVVRYKRGNFLNRQQYLGFPCGVHCQLNMRFALLLLIVLATGWSELMQRPTQQIPATMTEALTVSKGTYSAHFRKQPGKNVYEVRVA